MEEGTKTSVLNKPMDEEVLNSIKYIHNLVKKILGVSFDTEQIAVDIWLENYETQLTKGTNEPASYSLVKCRCIDQMRLRSNELKRNEIVTRYGTGENDLDPNKLELIGVIIRKSSLSPTERKLLYDRFYRDVTIEQLAKEHHVKLVEIRVKLDQILAELKRVSRNIQID